MCGRLGCRCHGGMERHIRYYAWLDGSCTCSASVHLDPADPLLSMVEDVDAAAAILSNSYICAHDHFSSALLPSATDHTIGLKSVILRHWHHPAGAAASQTLCDQMLVYSHLLDAIRRLHCCWQGC